MSRHLIATLLALTCLTGFAAEDPAVLIAQLQPGNGWTAPEPARTAVSDTLFDLIDGGAELYQEYGVNRVVSWQLDNEARSSIQIELYEMSDAPAAYGVWSLMQTGTFVRGDLGQGSLRFGYYVAFWGGPYFASVTGARNDPATQAEVDRLAAQLASFLPRDSAQPAWFTRLPAGGLEQPKYFRGRIGLSNIPEAPAALRFAIPEGLCVEYPGVQVLLLHYPDAAAAATELAQAPALGFAPLGAELVRTEADGTKRVVRARGEDLLVFSFTDDARFHAVADAAR